MNKLKKEELLEHFEFMFSTTKSCAGGLGKPLYPPIEQAYQQIKEMIQKPEVTNKWIEEKTVEMIEIISKGKILEAMSFVRKLVKEIQRI